MKFLPVSSVQTLLQRTARSLAYSPQSVRAVVLFAGIALQQLGSWPQAQMLPQIFHLDFSPQLAAQSSNKDNFAPLPYEKDEFPLFLQDVRRFEVVLIGSIPITLLFGSLVYDIVYSISDPDITSLQIASSNEDIFKKIGISISISGVLAIIDMVIHLGHRNKKRKERERILRESDFIGRAGSEEPGADPEQAGTEATEPAETQQSPAGTAAPQGN